MTKGELAAQVAQATGVEKSEVERLFDCITKTIKTEVSRGKTIYVRGFGSFQPKKRAAKIARNITAGTPLHVPAHFIASFKPSPHFNHSVSKLNSVLR